MFEKLRRSSTELDPHGARHCNSLRQTRVLARIILRLSLRQFLVSSILNECPTVKLRQCLIEN